MDFHGSNSIIRNGQKFWPDDLLLLIEEDGIKEPENIKGYILLVARVLRKPLRRPWLLKEIFNLCIQEDQREMRLCLIRVQVQAERMTNQDIQRYQQRRYVAPGD